jgi:hypothetical protein
VKIEMRNSLLLDKSEVDILCMQREVGLIVKTSVSLF